LCENILGLKNITSHWSWKGQVLGQSPKTLNKLIELRGKIAHKLKAGTPVYKATAIKYINFIGYLLVATHNAINEYLGQKIGKPPWPQYSYSKNK